MRFSLFPATLPREEGVVQVFSQTGGGHETNFIPSLKKKIVSLVPRTVVKAPPKNCFSPLRPRDLIE